MRPGVYCCVCLCAAAATVAAQIQPGLAPADGSIEGTVRDAATHEPVKKAEVTLSGLAPAALKAITDAAGGFAFHGLGAGDYRLKGAKSGYNPPQTLEIESSVPVRLGPSEQRKNVEVLLLPGGTVSGRVTNEEGWPVRGCAVSAAKLRSGPGRGELTAIATTLATNDRGEYRLPNLAPGRYYLLAQCRVELPAAHTLMARNDPRLPHETYLPQLYGGGLDLSAATKVTVAAGESLAGLDFQLTRVPAVTLRGSVSALVPGASGPINVVLVPANRMMRSMLGMLTVTDMERHAFRFRSVLPGSYVLYAFGMHQGNRLMAQRPVEVGSAPLEPVEIALGIPPELKGSLQFDCEDHPAAEGVEITLAPLDGPLFMPVARAQVGAGGAFVLPGVMAGRWRLEGSVGGGYLKSVSLGGAPVSPYGFQAGASLAGPLQIVVGCQVADLSVSVVDAPVDRPISVVVFPDDPERLGAGLERATAVTGGGPVRFGDLSPGRYRVCALDMEDPWPILERPDWLKVLESRSAAIDVPQGGHASTAVELVPRGELIRLLGERD